MFKQNYMSDVKQVDVTLRGKCNAGESHSDEKGYVLNMFCMWLVCSRITNFLSLPTLERDCYVCQYHSHSAWIIESPDETILKFKKDKGLCEGFPYINLENLKEHVFKPAGGTSAGTKSILKDLETKVKATKEPPQHKALAFIQTVHQNMEGFTKHELKGANLARKAQAILGHPTSKELAQVVSNNFGVNNCHVNPIDGTHADYIYGPDLGGVDQKQ